LRATCTALDSIATSITADWSWWTYFIVGGRPWKDNPDPKGTEACTSWRFDTLEATYDHLFVNPRRNAISREAYECLGRGEKPDGFVELMDEDPKAFFAGVKVPVSTYLPPVD
jgi:hypothetical protein